jgi:hypothetical protein
MPFSHLRPVSHLSHRAILVASARDICPNSLVEYNSTRFDVASRSRPGAFHSVDLESSTCDCHDFPKIRFCKHIAAVRLFYDEGDSDESEPMPIPARKETIQTLADETMSFCHLLASRPIDQSHPNYSLILEAFRSAKFHLIAAHASMAATNSRLSEERRITPSQKKCRGETPGPAAPARTGGVEGAPAPKRKCLPEARGLSERAIGVAAKVSQVVSAAAMMARVSLLLERWPNRTRCPLKRTGMPVSVKTHPSATISTSSEAEI